MGFEILSAERDLWDDRISGRELDVSTQGPGLRAGRLLIIDFNFQLNHPSSIANFFLWPFMYFK